MTHATRIAHIDMTTGTVDYQPVPEEWARKYIGARGLGVRYVFENGPHVDPLSPDNILCVMNGPLTGTEASMSGRLAVVTKSPLTGTVTDSHMGGWSAARLRWAGLDGLIFKGKADKPMYAYIEDGNVELRDADDLWGKNIHETIDLLKERYGEKDLTVMAIGPAGENQVNFACWMNENDRAAGRGGTGAVGGAKNLKAIVVKAAKKMPKAADIDRFKEARKKALATIMDKNNITAPRSGGLSVYGTNVLMNITNTIGALPGRNAQDTTFATAELVSGEYVKEHILVEDPTCHACPVACKKEVEIKEGPFAGLRMESVEYEPAWALGPNCGNDDIASVAKLIDMGNDLGMDVIELGVTLGAMMEMTEKGYTNGTGGLEWGDVFGMIKATEELAHKSTPMGEILAGGTSRVAAHFGHPELAMAVKGQGIPAYDPRGLKGMGLGYATSNRGACHLRGYSPASELGVIPLKTDPLAYEGKGALLKLLQDVHAFSDSLDLCKFSAFAEGAEEYAAQYAAYMGIEFSVEDVLTTGERIYNLERYYNNLAGFGEGSDYLPSRFLTEPSRGGGSEGHICELPEMLAEYYSERGWNNGVVTAEKLRALDIEVA